MRKWKCTICGYIHIGPTPPDVCPVCGAGPEAFVDEGPAEAGTMAPEVWNGVRPVMREVSYGIYVIGTKGAERLNGSTINTFIKVSEEPLRLLLGIQKTNLTADNLRLNPVAAISIIADDEEGFKLAGHFGLQSGRQVDKMAGIAHRLADNGCPILTHCVGFLEISLLTGTSQDLGSHVSYLAEVVNGGIVDGGKPMTYARYHETKAGRK